MITAGHCGVQRVKRICDKSVDSEPQKKAYVKRCHCLLKNCLKWQCFKKQYVIRTVGYIEIVINWIEQNYHEVTFFIDYCELVHNNRIVFEIRSENDVNLYSEYVLKKTFITYRENFIELLDLMAS